MDKEILEKYEEAKNALGEMLDAFQDDALFRMKYSSFLAAADSALSYIKDRYQGKINARGKKFDDWFKGSPRWSEELTHLTRARGYNIHKGYVPVGATREGGYEMDFVLITELDRINRLTDLSRAKSSQDESKSEPCIPPIKTVERWLNDEYRYMVYKTHNDQYVIPIIRSRYPAKLQGSRSHNKADLICLSMAQLNEINNIIINCQKEWP